ncbi:metaxin-1 isoform X2 [Syngnathus scovelli]|uniref:metaxin-1 isoform X2 n=1 Tax=Syngnathus scovelli TaxID=161590 RepID=UPI00210F28E1|nr:metaxin-1 isoform X2 [Syngnathus scovelli]
MAAHEELFVWEGDWGLPSVNSDCLVVLAYAQFSGAPLKVHKLSNPWRCPGGTIPALRTAHKEALWRPSDIIVHLQKQKYNADFDLSPKEAADSLAFVALVQEKLSPAVLYALWVEPKNFAEVTRRWYAEHVSFPLGLVLPGRMRRQVLDKLRLLRGDASLDPGDELEKESPGWPVSMYRSATSSQEAQRGSEKKLYDDATNCMDLLAQRLGMQKFFFGDSPSSLDAVVFGWLAPILKCELPSGKLQQHLKSLDNLHAFCANILLVYFPQNSGPRLGCSAKSYDVEHVPNRRVKQFLSALAAVGAMLSYALLTGMVSVQRGHKGALEGRRHSAGPEDDEDED